MNKKGENITKAFVFIQNFYKEVAQLIVKLDDLMEKEGWTSARGSTTTSEVSVGLKSPEKWLPDASFRLYENAKGDRVRKGIVPCYIYEGRIEEPLLIMGRITYEKVDKAQDWDIYNLWFDDTKERVPYKEYKESRPENRDLFIEKDVIDEAVLYAINLVDVGNEEDIKNKVYKKLSAL